MAVFTIGTAPAGGHPFNPATAGAGSPAGNIPNVGPGEYNSAGTARYIPALWSGKLIEKFYDATVLAAIANTDYAGEIKNQGDTVHIRTKATLTVKDYQSYQDLELETPSSTAVELQIDKGKYFAAIVDDVMETQADLNLLSMWADDASEQMKIAIDNDVLGNLSTDIDADNKGAAAGRISGNIDLGATGGALSLAARAPGAGETEVIDAILRAGQVLDEQNIPESGRWMIIPAWMAAMIKRSELRDASLTGDGTTMLRNGRLGMIDRFTLYASNLLPSPAAGETAIYAGHSHGLTFASQLTKMETIRSERTFGTIMRGLQVYGYKVVDGKALVEMIVSPA